MFISVHHKIRKPGQFWATAQRHIPALPEAGVQRVINIYPSKDMTQATCIWEADSIEVLEKYLRSKLSDWSEETYFEINEASAVGLTS